MLPDTCLNCKNRKHPQTFLEEPYGTCKHLSLIIYDPVSQKKGCPCYSPVEFIITCKNCKHYVKPQHYAEQPGLCGLNGNLVRSIVDPCCCMSFKLADKTNEECTDEHSLSEGHSDTVNISVKKDTYEQISYLADATKLPIIKLIEEIVNMTYKHVQFYQNLCKSTNDVMDFEK